MFNPRFAISPAATKALMQIEAARQAVGRLPLSVPMLDSLRRSARLMSTHFSTQIEGNRLTPSQVATVLAGGGGPKDSRSPGAGTTTGRKSPPHGATRGRYEFVEREGTTGAAVTERTIRTIHGLVMFGRKKPTPYRDGQNVIRDGRTGGIVYLPPEAPDVAPLMKQLLTWITASSAADGWPVPVVAALAHYQFATIHPYFDGNGRTARLLTTLILHRGGYGLNGIYSLEEYYAKNLAGYYEGLAAGPSHNYYEGRAEADVTRFVTYFCQGMAESFAAVQTRAEEAQAGGFADQSGRLRGLDTRQRQVLSLFLRSKEVRSAEVAQFFSIKPRAAADLCTKWVKVGFLVVADPSKKARRYRLTRSYEALIRGGGAAAHNRFPPFQGMAAPVSFSRWILLMASGGMGRGRPNVARSSPGRASSWIFPPGRSSTTTKRDRAPTQPPEAMRMRFYNQPHQYYCGGDLHARTLYLHVLDAQGATRFEKPGDARGGLPRRGSRRRRPGRWRRAYVRLVLAGRSVRTRVDLRRWTRLAMKAIHAAGKTKTDKIDAAKLVGLLRGGVFCGRRTSYPKAKRAQYSGNSA